METIYLSPSGIATYENCPRAYFLDRVLKVRTAVTSCALGFGGSLASAMEAFVAGTVTGTFVDPVPVFQSGWATFCRENAVKYGRYDSQEGLTATGTVLMEMFPQAWEREGLTVALDVTGKPMMERKLTVDLGAGTRLVTKLDLMAFTRDWQLLLIDQKTTKTPTDIRFALLGEQLTAYQAAVTAHAPTLGLPQIDGLAYWELIKRTIPKKPGAGQGPTIEAIGAVKPRSNADVQTFVSKAQNIAQRVRDRDFPKTPRMAWNSPCLQCDFLDLCAQKKTDGLTFRSEETKEAVLKLAA